MSATVVEQRYELIPIDLLEPHPDNPNQGDLEAIAESININGFYGATIVRELAPGRYQILAGEHRWRALVVKNNGDGDIPCIVVDTDDVGAVRIMLADNETARRGRYKPDVLGKVLASLGSLDGTGFDLDQLRELEEGREPAPGEEHLEDEMGGTTKPLPEFVREYGIVLTFPGEEAQEGFYNWLLEHAGLEPHQIRIASI